MSLVHTARYQIVSGAFRSGLDQHRCFYFGKSVFCEIVSGQFRQIVTEGQVVLHLLFTKIQVTVFETQIVVYVIVVLDVDRRRIRLGIKDHVVCDDLDITGRKIRVLRFSFCHYALDAHHIFASQGVCLFKQLLRDLIVEHHLRDAGLVSHITEDETAQISSLCYPAVEHDFFSDVFFSQFPAHVGSLV